ncbi:prolipoprotein diacylglyceryl transferase [Jiangella alba]|uniref:Phosphatidylglycerol--prolipoprotein diacylglyceryl transferase n=1 Tax=Jiangella alba TaxID=561176 RepID=A0A1H5DQ67_9ACTN|nr:prolipoprotein diacylglyceryl transferase [Jiangella alba]SED80984.1 prolipoprotein diacylglyceryl transferase [Jiangella alba]
MIATPAVVPTFIPSPSSNSIDVFGFELRAYALCIMAGIVVAIWLTNRRWLARGGEAGVVADIAVWAVPFGIIGGRIYHVITDNQLYFREGKDPWQALEIWKGGLGIWGAIAMGALGVWIACRRRGVPFAAMADAAAPGILFAQALGRVGNWFNQELFGKPTDLPWGLEIAPGHRPDGYADVATFHPTFLYEALWAVAVAFLLLWLDKRYTIGHGRLFALYVAGYTLGRGFWEYLRIDPANHIFGVRVNLWVSGLIFVAAMAYFFWSLKRHPGREDPEELRGYYDQPDPFDDKGKAEDETPITLPDDEPEDAKPSEASKAGAEEKKPADEKKPGDEPKPTEKKDTAAEEPKAADEAKPAESKPAEAGDKAADEKPAPAVKKTSAATVTAPATTTATTAAAKKTTAKKATAAKKAPVKKATAAAKKAPAAKKTATEQAAPEQAGDAAPAKSAAAKKASPAKKTATKTTAAQKTAAKKAATKKAAAKKAAPEVPAQAATEAPKSAPTTGSAADSASSPAGS